MNSVGIIGFGRFGKVLSNILQKGFKVKAYDLKMSRNFPGVEFVDKDTILKEKIIFIAVPISAFESLINDIAPKLKVGNTVVDVCSVKNHPVKIMENRLSDNIGIINTHPMFGPDSFISNNRLKMMMHNTRDTYGQYGFWRGFFIDQGIEVIEITPDEHDRLAAKTQGVTHFLGRMLKEFGIKKTALDTQGFRDLLDLVDQTCNDTWQLYSDLQHFNPYTSEMISELKKSINSIETQIKEISNVES